MRSAAFACASSTRSHKLKAFRMLSARYRYPRPAYAAKFATIAGIVNLAAGFEPTSANPRCRQLKIHLLSQQVY